jgi:hypothetical protein
MYIYIYVQKTFFLFRPGDMEVYIVVGILFTILLFVLPAAFYIKNRFCNHSNPLCPHCPCNTGDDAEAIVMPETPIYRPPGPDGSAGPSTRPDIKTTSNAELSGQCNKHSVNVPGGSETDINTSDSEGVKGKKRKKKKFKGNGQGKSSQKNVDKGKVKTSEKNDAQKIYEKMDEVAAATARSSLIDECSKKNNDPPSTKAKDDKPENEHRGRPSLDDSITLAKSFDTPPSKGVDINQDAMKTPTPKEKRSTPQSSRGRGRPNTAGSNPRSDTIKKPRKPSQVADHNDHDGDHDGERSDFAKRMTRAASRAAAASASAAASVAAVGASVAASAAAKVAAVSAKITSETDKRPPPLPPRNKNPDLEAALPHYSTPSNMPTGSHNTSAGHDVKDGSPAHSLDVSTPSKHDSSFTSSAGSTPFFSPSKVLTYSNESNDADSESHERLWRRSADSHETLV